MIWIATLCLLAIAAWLILNGLNERRWVQAHSHDETVAADEGFLPSFSTTVDRKRIGADGSVSYVPEPTALGRSVSKVRDASASLGSQLEPKARQAREKAGEFKDRVAEKLTARGDGTVDKNRKDV